jgi:hypothetical protein
LSVALDFSVSVVAPAEEVTEPLAEAEAVEEAEALLEEELVATEQYLPLE